MKPEPSGVAGPGYDDVKPAKTTLEYDLDYWFKQMQEIVLGKAQSKGYADNAQDDGRDLLDFVNRHCPSHTEGEIIYKVIRWTKKRDPEDLLKIAAWAFLAWDQHRRQQGDGWSNR